MPIDSTWLVWPVADGGVNPGTSAIGRIAVGSPSADTAGAQPDPSTIATSWSPMPTLWAMNCAAVSASTGGSLIGTPLAELVQHAQKDVALVRGNLPQPSLLATLDVCLHRVLDRAAGIGDRQQACAPVVGVGHPLDVAV